jgi:hypothetical protein
MVIKAHKNTKIPLHDVLIYFSNKGNGVRDETRTIMKISRIVTGGIIDFIVIIPKKMASGINNRIPGLDNLDNK